ncbi:hypothetical protein ABIA31_009361 [Catenulispora sp. MAP5-51]|uniref:hypothetical protein n=1 Tax=Catenulispora sp. MAP5-51 TaxID=3156298 RepID=UPI0035187DAA
MTSDLPSAFEPALDAADPSLPSVLVHYVGRARGSVALPAGVPATAEARAASILLTRSLLASKVPAAGENLVSCASDVSAAELEAAFDRGINSRGAFQPWAIVLNRGLTYGNGTGMRPVHYVDHSTADAYRRACESIDGPGWGGLVMPIRLQSYFGSLSDWMHEREWRWCAQSGAKRRLLDLRGRVRAVIAPVRSWEPYWTPPAPQFPGQIPADDVEYEIERWFWDPELRRLAKDGHLTVPALPLVASTEPIRATADNAGHEDTAAGSVVHLDRTGEHNTRQPMEADMEPGQTETIFVGGGESPGPWAWELRCPFCGDNTIDRNVNGEYVDDHEAVSVHPDQDKYESPIGTRGGFVSISMLCAACCRGFDFVVANHKGSEQIGIVPHS